MRSDDDHIFMDNNLDDLNWSYHSYDNKPPHSVNAHVVCTEQDCTKWTSRIPNRRVIVYKIIAAQIKKQKKIDVENINESLYFRTVFQGQIPCSTHVKGNHLQLKSVRVIWPAIERSQVQITEFTGHKESKSN